MIPNKLSLSQRLKEKRMDAGIKQGQIGELVEKDQTTVSLYEKRTDKLKAQGAEFAMRFFQAYGFSDQEALEMAQELFSDMLAQLMPHTAKPTPGARLKKLREDKDLTHEQVAELAGGAVTARRLSNLEDKPGAWHKVTEDEVKNLARAYSMRVINFLDSVNGTPYPAKPNIYTDEVVLENPDIRRNSRLVPEYNMVGVGPGGQDGEILGYIDVPDSWAGDHVGYRVSGDSMSPTIKDGDTVVVRVQNHASAKNIIVCWLPEEGMICKYLQEKTEDGLHMLTSFNAAHPPIWTRDLKIYGLVREIRSRVELINGNH